MTPTGRMSKPKSGAQTALENWIVIHGASDGHDAEHVAVLRDVFAVSAVEERERQAAIAGWWHHLRGAEGRELSNTCCS